MADEPDLPGSLHESASLDKPPALTPVEEAAKAVVDEAVEFLAFVTSVESTQRRQEDEDLEFEGVDAWLPEHRNSRGEHVDEVTGRKTPARPTLTVNLIDQPLQQTISEARQARLALTVKPKAGLANTKTAGHYKGLIRAIQVDSGAQEVRLWALERTAKCGRGAYLISAEYANDGDFDIDLVIERILDQGTVYWDPYAQRADRNDADRCMITDWMSEDERKRRWPGKPLIPNEGAFDSADNPWFAADVDSKQRSVRVATFYKVHHTTKSLAYHPAIGPMLLEKMPPEYQALVRSGQAGMQLREVDQRSVMIYVVDGTQILEQTPWLGRYIPVIPTSGKEYLVKGKRIWKGMVTNAKDVLRAINVLISSATELAGQLPRVPYIMYAGQDEGFEEMWDDAPVKNYTRLYINAEEIGGKPAPFPQRQQLELEIQGLMFLLRMLQDMFHAITGSVPPTNRAVNPYERSGKAIEALQRQGAAGTSNYLDNLATISMMQEGRVLVDAIPKYYDRAGRVLRVMGEENDDETAVMLKVPVIRDEEGNPVPVPCPVCQGQGVTKSWNWFIGPQPCVACQGSRQATRENMPPEFNGEPVEYVDFSDGEYKVSISIEHSYQTKQEEALAGMNQLAESAPPLVPLYADLWVRAMGFSGSTEIADRLQSQNPSAQSEKEHKNVPPAFLAQFQALKMQHDQAMAALQEAKQIIDSDGMKAAGQKEIAVIKAAAAEALEKVKQEGKLMEATAEIRGNQQIEVLKGQIKTMQLEAEHRHEVLMAALERRGEREAAAEAAQHGDTAASRNAARTDIAADRQAGRDENAAARQARRDEEAADRQAGREDTAASREATRAETAAERQAARDRAQPGHD